MRVLDAVWASRFYGMDVPPALAAKVRERLTEERADLVDAHLAINRASLGAIDKTLSGFVILDDAGDHFTLHDLRDGGQVFRQDHETRALVLQSDEPPRSSRSVSSVTLLRRYQWLVWMLAQPLAHDGVPAQSADVLVRHAIGRFRHTWPQRAVHDAAFEAELAHLATDPHLAIYWLLHTSLLADEERVPRVLAAIGDGGPPLLRAFVARFGGLPLAGELPIVPEFRCRRALASLYGAFEPTPEELSRAALRALEIEPGTNTLRNGLQIIDGIEKGHIAAAAVGDAMARIAVSTSGVELVLAALAKREGATSSAHADNLARRIELGTQMWWFALEALWRVHALAFDAEALGKATRDVLACDRYHPRALEMAIRAARLAGEPTAALEADLEVALAILPALQQTYQSAALPAAVAALAEPARRALATRILQRAAINRPEPSVAAWAAGVVVGDAHGVALVGHALASLDAPTQDAVIARAKAAIDGPAHPLVEVLFAFLDGPEPPAHDLAGGYTAKAGKESVVTALAPHAVALFDRFAQLLERPAGASAIRAILGKLANPFEKDTYAVPRLDAAQAVRLAKAMIAILLHHPQDQARTAAGHGLFRFHHPGAESFLVDALDAYAARFAAGEDLEGLVANLYNAVRGLKTPRARSALLARLATERRAFWRLGAALSDSFDDDLHAEALALLRATRDGRAAGVYAYALADHANATAALLELAREIADWPTGDDKAARGFLHYALAIGEAFALEARDFALVRRLHEAAAWIDEPPLHPEAHARGRAWQNPLDSAAFAAAIDDVLAGKPPPSVPAPPPAPTPLDEPVPSALDDAPPATTHAVALEGMRAHLAGAVQIDERFLAWDAKHAHVREVLRLGTRVVTHAGANDGTIERHVVAFASEDAAAGAFTQLRANLPAGYSLTDPFYVPGIGTVVRNYYVPLPDGAYTDKREHLHVPVDVLDLDAAIRAHEETELRLLRDDNATLLSIELSRARKRPLDLTVAEWIERRFRNDTKSPVWHLRALADLAIYFEAHALVFPGLDLQLGAPASDADIAAFAAERTHAVPDALRTLWRTHGRASWQFAGRGMRLLGPREALARRPAARAVGERLLAQRTPATTGNAPLDGLDVLVETIDGTPITLVADVARGDGRIFMHAVDDPADAWWDSNLSWMLATRLLADLGHAFAAHAPILARLYYGQRNPDAQALVPLAEDPPWPTSTAPAKRTTAGREAAVTVPATSAPATKVPAKRAAPKKASAKAPAKASATREVRTKASVTTTPATNTPATNTPATNTPATKTSTAKRAAAKEMAAATSAAATKASSKTSTAKRAAAKAAPAPAKAAPAKAAPAKAAPAKAAPAKATPAKATPAKTAKSAAAPAKAAPAKKARSASKAPAPRRKPAAGTKR